MKQSTPKNIPALRFEEFEGEWKERKLGEQATFSKGKGISKADIKEDGLTECIRYGELYTHYGELISNIKSKTNLPKKNLVLSKSNDIIIPASGEAALDIATASCVLKNNIALGGDLNIIRTKIHGVFLAYYLNSSKKKAIARLAQGISVVHLYSSQLKTLKINLPSLPEQQKIATFLTTIDTKIQQIKKKKALLAQNKKGVMQRLFSQEIRFKDEEGKAFGEWEEKRFNEIFSFRSTNSLSRDKLNYNSGSIKNIHYGDIHTKFQSTFNITKEKVPFINDEVNLEKIKEDNYCKEKDLVIADASENYADIGKSIELINLANEKVLAGLHTFIARPDKTDLAKGFSGYLMQSFFVRKQIMIIAQGTKVLGLSMTRLGKIKIILPLLMEQQKIANFLTILDTKIQQIEVQLKKMEEFKRGLLQGMFV